ncbi:thiamine pyrophosphokinase-related protein [Diplodia corticola]|uniref:Thiamin pyrophosphokinase-related protein n=1 Tax=Diplodia corticola TaxID=236234 RepID=A0A1J9RGT8_9PEZI|nr:thiamine pyrophosphokinase-related protein [Diplodia corticola]OJD31755.1 thiamin pyrophosphokinase-related protein [Diplodia corticola]
MEKIESAASEWPSFAARGKSNLDLVNDCDNFPRPDLDNDAYTDAVAGLYTLHVADHHATLGFVRPHVAETLSGLPAWDVSPESQTLILVSGIDEAERTAIVAATTAAMRQTRHFALLNKGWRGELYPVYGNAGELLFRIERAATPLFGVLACSVNLTCYVRDRDRDTDRYRFWVPRRARSKPTYPAMLDNTLAAGLPAAEKPMDVLAREAERATALPADVVRARAKAVGNVSYFLVRDSRAGGETGLLQPESQFVYDLELRDDDGIEPRPTDGEVEGFALLSTPEVQAALSRGEFKPDAALVLLDFFIRHGILTPENEPDYVEIVSRLHRRFRFPVPRSIGH